MAPTRLFDNCQEQHSISAISLGLGSPSSLRITWDLTRVSTMSASDKITRVMAVLEGRRPDRPPVSFWHHFEAHQRHGPEAVSAHLDHLQAFDLDFLKVMSDNGYPGSGPVRTVADLASLEVLTGDEPEFARQLELLEALARELNGVVLMATTLFNAWATLRRMIKPKTRHGPPSLAAAEDETTERMSMLLAEDREAVAGAIRVIGQSLANFARRCIEAGADGIFLSVRDDWVDTPANGPGTYERIVRPADLAILAGASAGRFNLLHVCGRAVNFDAFAEYPVQVINWADRSAGPTIGEVVNRVQPAICGGVDNLETLPRGTPQQCADQVRDALAQAGGRPLLIGPGCTFDPQCVPRENLEAVCRAAREG
jgi:uroporphyrinogen decarboxylase